MSAINTFNNENENLFNNSLNFKCRGSSINLDSESDLQSFIQEDSEQAYINSNKIPSALTKQINEFRKIESEIR